MVDSARAWLALTSACAATLAAVTCVTCPVAVAEPMPPPMPTPVPVAQTVPVVPAPAPAPVVTPAALGATAPTVPAPGAVPAPAPAPVAATSGTLRDYFAGKHVQLEPQHSVGFSALSITLPLPAGWAQVPNPNVPDAFAVIANRNSPDLYTPNAQVVVYKLVGDFDTKEAITHGFIDSQSLPAWQTTDASLADFYGLPSAAIEGTYRQNDMTLNTCRRHVIATTANGKYLVSLSVTTQGTSQAAPVAADATDAIIKGFRVSTPASGPRPAS